MIKKKRGYLSVPRSGGEEAVDVLAAQGRRGGAQRPPPGLAELPTQGGGALREYVSNKAGGWTRWPS